MKACPIVLVRNIPVYVPTSSEGIQQHMVNILNGRLEVPLNNAMKLECLSGCDFEGPRSMFVSDLIHLEPLIRFANTTGHPDTNHEGICRFEVLSLTLVTNITVILLVYSVELGQLSIAGC